LDTKRGNECLGPMNRSNWELGEVSTLAAVIPCDTPSVRQRPGRDVNVSRILDSAQELFAKRGPRAVTVRQVAEYAGVSHALVHK